MTDGHFDENIASGYDEGVAWMYAPEVLGPTVEFLAGLAGDGRALEFAVGTGRVALALRARGIDVSGIELSQAMVRRLRAKDGGDELDVAVGDMTTTRVAGEFSLVYLVFNTIGNLLTQDEQVECFINAARHLAPGGAFVIEIGVPRLRQLPVGSRLVPFALEDGYVGIDEYDTVTQRLDSHHVSVDPDGRGRHEVMPQRYVWPSEMDLMARIAGLRLAERWADWHRSPFTAESPTGISVWRRPA